MKNSKIVLLSVLLIGFVSVIVNAQETNESNSPRIGIKGGVNFSNLYGDDADDTKMRTGFNVGVFCKVPIGVYSIAVAQAGVEVDRLRVAFQGMEDANGG